LDNTPFRLDDPEFKLKYFWWYFNKDAPFISVMDRLPANGSKIEFIFIVEGDGLPANAFGIYANDKFYMQSESDPAKFKISHWRCLAKPS